MTVTEQTFATKPASLFEVLINPDTYPEWLVGAKQIREVSPDWPAVGSFFKHVVGFGPLAIPDKTRLVAIDAPRSLTLLVKVRPLLEARVTFDITPHELGSHLRMTEDPVGVFTVISPVAQPLIRARNERSLKRLAEVVNRAP